MTDDLEKRLRDLEEKFSNSSGRTKSHGLGWILGGLFVGGIAYLGNRMVRQPLKTGLLIFGALMGTMIMSDYIGSDRTRQTNQAVQSYGRQQEGGYSTVFGPVSWFKISNKSLIPIQKISTSSDLEPTFNNIISNSPQGYYRVIKDGDREWDKYCYENFVIPKREKNKSYPYIVRGDFNWDGVYDLAAIVTSKVNDFNNNREHLAIVLSGKNDDADIMFFENKWGDAIEYFQKRHVDSRWGQPPLELKGDAIHRVRYESASRLIYWDGDTFKEYQMSD